MSFNSAVSTLPHTVFKYSQLFQKCLYRCWKKSRSNHCPCITFGSSVSLTSYNKEISWTLCYLFLVILMFLFFSNLFFKIYFILEYTEEPGGPQCIRVTKSWIWLNTWAHTRTQLMNSVVMNSVVMNSVVLVECVQWSCSVTHIHISILFQVHHPFRLLQNFTTVPFSIQQVLTGYVSNIAVWIC